MCINNVVSLRHYTSPQTSTHTHTNLSSQAKTLAKSNKQSDCECEEGENSILWSRIHLLPELNWNFIVQVTVNLKTLKPPLPKKNTHTHTHTKQKKGNLSCPLLICLCTATRSTQPSKTVLVMDKTTELLSTSAILQKVKASCENQIYRGFRTRIAYISITNMLEIYHSGPKPSIFNSISICQVFGRTLCNTRVTPKKKGRSYYQYDCMYNYT